MQHITEAIKRGYYVKIVVSQLSSREIANYGELFRKYNLEEKIVLVDFGIPSTRSMRILKFLLLLVKNISSCRKLFFYFKNKRSRNFNFMFEWNFYKHFKNADIFHIQYGTNHKPLDELKKCGLYKMPVITTFHGHDAFFPINGFIPKENYYETLFKYTELFTANTPYLEEQLLKIDCPPEKISTLPVGVDINFFTGKTKKGIDLNLINLLSVGRLEEIKGHKMGIKAVKNLRKEGININYTIIGEGSLRNKLCQLVDDHNLKGHVILKGSMSQKKIMNYMHNSDIFLMTSTVVNGDTRETQGLVALEAQSCNLPIVAFKSGGVAYTVKDGVTGFLVLENDLDSFTSKIRELIENSTLYSEMTKNSREFVKDNYCHSKLFDSWEDIYKSLKL
nr:glycosyltransferase [uncultured Christiangramia sp.]